MGNDLEIIKKIEEKLGMVLKQSELKHILELGQWGYSIDKKGNIIGLNLCGLTNVDISLLRDLTNLTHLVLNSNNIRDISPLSRLTNLMDLRLGNNKISDLSPLKQLKKLKRLDLQDNKISQLPTELVQLGMEINWYYDYYGRGISLKGNPLEIPPVEIVKQGAFAVLNYFKELGKESVQLLHSKLLIVGNGEVGKTTLMKKLQNNNFQVDVGKEETTHGINILRWELQCPFADGDIADVKINFWDFGGQDIYHATHQFFLTKRSLYLFVWEARKEEETRSFDYWLNIIKLLSDESPVIVVMNKADIRCKHVDEASFKDKFQNIVTFLQVSCVTGQGIKELTEQIRSTLANMEYLRDKLPKAWTDIRDDLKKEKKNYISLEEYFAICKKHGLNEERAEFLSDYLHDLGVILHYRHDKLLENTVILNPEWATEAVYKLIDTRKIFENKGRFRFDDLKTYWNLSRFPREKHAQLVRLMEKFELCFPITGSDIHIVPELLPANRPSLDLEKYKKPENIHFEYLYDFM
jgi:small GTP-binding protein